jgi:hypothetical protein
LNIWLFSVIAQNVAVKLFYTHFNKYKKGEADIMGCFLVPMTQAIVTTVVQKVVEKRELKTGVKQVESTGLTWSRKLGWLNKMLWGGTALLALEHIWHGEVVPWFPFLTAMNNPADIAPMLHEIATVGVAMSLTVTLVWGIIVLIAEQKVRSFTQLKATTIKGA